MGILDYLKKREHDVMCPECEKHQKHVKLVEANGKTMECPECHYLHGLKK
jgi:rubredoxin